nr:ATP-binding protein [uncultured Desulfobacter sp.]
MYLSKNGDWKNIFLIFLPFLIAALSLTTVEWINKDKRIDNAIEKFIEADMEEVRQLAANPLFRLFFDSLYYDLTPETELNKKRIIDLFFQKTLIAEKYNRPDLAVALISSDSEALITFATEPGFHITIDKKMLPTNIEQTFSKIEDNIHKSIAPIEYQNKILGYIAIWNKIPKEDVARVEFQMTMRNLLIIFSCLAVLMVVLLFFYTIEKKRTDKIIKTQQEYYKAIVEGHQGFIYILDSECNIEFMNERLIEFVGADAQGQKCHEALSKLSDPCPWCCSQMDTGSRTQTFEFQTPADSTWYSVVKNPIAHEDGLSSTLVILQDISVRKKAEHDVIEANHYIQDIIDSMPSVIIGVDEHERITQWNKKAEKTTGILQETALNQPLLDKFPRLEQDLGKIRAVILSRERQEETGREFEEAGKIRYEDMAIFPISSGTGKGVVIRLDDVTGRIQVQELMIQSEKMLSVGGLAAGMAHEINNPLAGMMQTSNVMANRLGKNLTMPSNIKAADKVGTSIDVIEKYMEERGIFRMLESITESGKRIADLVTNMLNFSRKSVNIKSAHHLAELMDKAVDLAKTDYDLKKEYDFKSIEIIRKYDDNLPEVICEGPEIQQVILNILKNGAQAMREANSPKPRFTLRTRQHESNTYICMEIGNNGPAIDPEVQKRIFEPFYTTKPVGIGTGLGLSISYFIIVKKHKGRISVRSRPGEETIFSIQLPV